MAMRQTSGLTVQGGPPRRPTQAQTRALREITKIMGVVGAAKRRAIRKELWHLARVSIVFQTFERDAPTPGDVRKLIETVETACQQLVAAISQIERRDSNSAETVALIEIFQADAEIYHENALNFDFSDLLVKLHCLTAATKLANDNSASGKGRRPNAGFRTMVRGLREIVQRETTFAPTANWNDVEGIYTGPFVDCVDQALQLWGDMPNAPDRPEGVALGKAIKRALD